MVDMGDATMRGICVGVLSEGFNLTIQSLKSFKFKLSFILLDSGIEPLTHNPSL